jgi:hypothetical protein
MAITVTTAIAANVAAFAPVVLAGTTTRNPFTSGTRQSQAAVSYADNGGVVDITVASTTGWLADDTVLIAGATGDFAVLNGRHSIGSIPDGASILLTTAWPGAMSTGDKGTVYRMNDNLTVRCDVVNASSVVVAQPFAQVKTDGTWSIDLQKPLQSELDSVFNLTAGQIAVTGCSHAYTVKLYECWQDVDYTLIAQEDVSEQQTTIAHRTTSYAATYISGTSLLTGNYTAGAKIVFVFQTDKTSLVRLTVTRYTNGTPAATNYDVTTYTNGWAGWTFDIASTVDYTTISVTWNNGSEYEAIKSLLTVKNIKGCETTLHYLNRLGGYEQQVFHDYEDVQETDRVDVFAAETYQIRTLFTPQYARSQREGLRDIVTSPEVYDTTGTAVKMQTNSTLYNARLFEQSITIRYDQNHITQ